MVEELPFKQRVAGSSPAIPMSRKEKGGKLKRKMGKQGCSSGVRAVV